MSEPIAIRQYFQPIWCIVKSVKEEVESILNGIDEAINHSCKMTASELMENALKYGDAVGENRGIMFDVTIDDHIIRIKVANRIIREEDLANIEKHINDINQATDPRELYMNRLRTLLENPNICESQLGLYRIAVEGEFKLTYELEGDVVTIIASRELI